jgi:hypothetical protein
MRYLLLSSFLLVLLSCTAVFKGLQKSGGDINAIQKFKPAFTVALYKTEVNVMGNYLSGLLLIKKMPDSSTRILFSNELGFKFFDFEFSKDGGFKVLYILSKMDRKAVVKTLRKDFELVLMEPLSNAKAYIKTDSTGNSYYIFPQKKGYNYYITNPAATELLSMQRASKQKSMVTVTAKNYINGLPDTIGISHHNFNFTIGLKRIER